ncbi:MAG: hypothetical protein M1826_004669 [Phylliscum demangeonii]|nr:MAG: hypothetical protein M1826_004669 [Phylliscum demangeonii]
MDKSFVCIAWSFVRGHLSSQKLEADSGEIELDDDPSSISRMLSYLYTNNYKDDSGIEEKEPDLPVDLGEASIDFAISISDDYPQEPDDDPPELDRDPSEPRDGPAVDSAAPPLAERALRNNALVYAAAEKYDIPLLKALARKKFIARAGQLWPPAGLQNVVRLVYQKTPDRDQGLRMVVAELCAQHLPALIGSDKFRSSVLEFSSFGLDMLRACLAKHEVDKEALWRRYNKRWAEEG